MSFLSYLLPHFMLRLLLILSLYIPTSTLSLSSHSSTLRFFFSYTIQKRKEKMKLYFATLLVTLLFSSSFLEPTMGLIPSPKPSPKPISGFCQSKCSNRCAKAGVQDRCIKYCGICCEECKCVPSGTYGNKHECPCYRDKKNTKGKPKCP